MKRIGIFLLTILMLAFNVNVFMKNATVVSFNQKIQKDLEYSFFYTRSADELFSDHNLKKEKASVNQKTISFSLQTRKLFKIKLDFGENPGTIFLSEFKIGGVKLDLHKFEKNKDISEMVVEGDTLKIVSTASHPSIIYQENLNIKTGRVIHYGILIILLFSYLVISSAWIYLIKNNKDKINIIFITLFGIFLILPMSKISVQEISIQENRKLSPYPPLLKNNQINEKYGTQFDAWFNDHFRCRETFMNIYDYIIGHVNLKPYSRTALTGKDGWLFGTTYNAVDMFQNNNLFTNDELQIIGQNLIRFVNSAKQKGVKNIYFLFNNDKESIYPEFYPANIKKLGPISRLEQVLSYLHEHHPKLKVLNFNDKLKELKKSENIFYKTGTHMNHMGSFYNYKFMMEEIKKDYPDLPILKLDDFTITESDSFTQPSLDLNIYFGFKFLPSYSSENFRNKILTLKNPHASNIDKRMHDYITLSLWENNHLKSKHSVFVIGDSFFDRDLDKYVESFSDIRFLFVAGGGSFDVFDLLVSEKKELLSHIPEIVIVESTELFLDRLLTVKFPAD